VILNKVGVCLHGINRKTEHFIYSLHNIIQLLLPAIVSKMLFSLFSEGILLQPAGII